MIVRGVNIHTGGTVDTPYDDTEIVKIYTSYPNFYIYGIELQDSSNVEGHISTVDLTNTTAVIHILQLCVEVDGMMVSFGERKV